MSVNLVESGAALQSMRNSDFDVHSAYGEVIDNSIQAEATDIKVMISFDAATSAKKREPIKKVAFGDNGLGMDKDTLHRCLQLGYSSRYNDRSGIGRFGVGATLAAINQCKKVELYSKEAKGKWFYTYIDLEEITARPSQMTEIPKPVEKALPDEFKGLVGEDRGTLVVWSKYDRQPADASEILKEFKVWVGRTYRQFIWEGVTFSVNGEKVHAIDPLYVTTEHTKFADDPRAHEFKVIKFPWPIAEEDRVPGGPLEAEIQVRMSLLPEEFRPTQGSGNSNVARERYIDMNNGISIMRNGREVFYGIIPFWPGERFEEIDRWWGCEISFDAVLDKEFTVKNIKRGAIPVTELKRALKDHIEPTRKTCLERVREMWAQKKAETKTTNPSESVETGHSEAEQVAKATATPKGVIDKKKDIEKETEKYTEQWLKDEDARQKAAWKAKFQSQPFTIIDGEWRGPEFVEIANLGGASVLRYNMRHDFFQELESIRKDLATSETENPHARKLKVLIDLLLISYAKAETMFEPETPMKAEKLLEQLKMNWGNYLSNYLETYKSENSNVEAA
jgi:hypothetical protein